MDKEILPKKKKLWQENLELRTKFVLWEIKKEVRKFLIVSDVYLMTSHYEGISLTTIEALACKIPAILYDVPGLRDFNKEQLCSLLIPEQSTEIVKAIKKLRTNSGEKEMIIKNGYEMVMRKFFLPTNVRQIFKLYQGS